MGRDSLNEGLSGVPGDSIEGRTYEFGWLFSARPTPWREPMFKMSRRQHERLEELVHEHGPCKRISFDDVTDEVCAMFDGVGTIRIQRK